MENTYKKTVNIEGKKRELKYNSKKARDIDYDWYDIRSLLGNNDWAWFFLLCGGREAGKSYRVMKHFLKEWKYEGKPFTWLRLNERSMEKMLRNKADKLIDADLRRKYDLDIKVIGNQVFDHGKPMCKVLALSTFYNDKGVALYDNEYDLGYNICLDEMNREVSERVTFDINYAFVNQMENLIRSTKSKIKVFLIGNTLAEASDILCSFGFIPETFGRYYLRSKRAVIDYIPPTLKYLKRRRGTVADILAPESSTFTNELAVDKTLICKNRLTKPRNVIKFGKEKNTWFTLWEGSIITHYNGEKVRAIPMRPYLDEVFNTEERDLIIASFDMRMYLFRDLFTQKDFKRNLELLKPRK